MSWRAFLKVNWKEDKEEQNTIGKILETMKGTKIKVLISNDCLEDIKENMTKNLFIIPTIQKIGIKDKGINLEIRIIGEEFSNFMIKEVFLFDLQGRLLKRKIFTESSGTIDVFNLPKGLYILKVTTDSHYVFSKKIVKL